MITTTQKDKIIIGALHIPDLRKGTNPPSISYLEDYVLTNAEIFYSNGIDSIYLQDQTQSIQGAYPETISVLSSLGTIVKHAYPDKELGITCEVHDPYAALAAAYASNADFVRLKVYVGTMVKTEGLLYGCGIPSRQYRDHLGNQNIRILCDIFDRTGYPVGDTPLEEAIDWAMFTGTDGFVITGHSFQESLSLIKRAKKVCKTFPVLMGGSATTENILSVLEIADGVIVSSALMQEYKVMGSLARWDADKISSFVAKVNSYYSK